VKAESQEWADERQPSGRETILDLSLSSLSFSFIRSSGIFRRRKIKRKRNEKDAAGNGFG